MNIVRHKPKAFHIATINIDVSECDAGAISLEPIADCEPDTPCTTRNDGDLVGEGSLFHAVPRL